MTTSDVVPVRELTRRELVDEAFRLFARPPAPLVEITVDDVLAAFPGAVEVTAAPSSSTSPAIPSARSGGRSSGCARAAATSSAPATQGHRSPLAVYTWRTGAHEARLAARLGDATSPRRRGEPSKLAKILLEGEEPVLCHAARRACPWALAQVPDSDELVATLTAASPDFARRSGRVELELVQVGRRST